MEEALLTPQSSLSGSFAPPSMKPPPAPPAPTPAQQITGSTDTEEDAGPVPGMDEWKNTYDKYVSDWQAESSIARQRAEDTRKQIEAEHAAIAKKMEDEKKTKKKEEAEKKRQKERDEKLKRELAEEKASGLGKRRADLTSQDKEKVKEAWEMVKGGGDTGPKPKDTVADVRGVMPQDVKAGNVDVKGQSPDASKDVSHDFSRLCSADYVGIIVGRSVAGRSSRFESRPKPGRILSDTLSIGHFSDLDRSVRQHFPRRGPLSTSIRFIRRSCFT
jgi:hypothetical protein